MKKLSTYINEKLNLNKDIFNDISDVDKLKSLLLNTEVTVKQYNKFDRLIDEWTGNISLITNYNNTYKVELSNKYNVEVIPLKNLFDERYYLSQLSKVYITIDFNVKDGIIEKAKKLLKNII